MLRRTLRRLRFALFAVLTTVVIALAVLVGLTQLAMPWLVRNPERIEAWISERVHQPVHIGHVTGAWLGGGPALTLEDVRIGVEGGDKPVLKVPRAEIAFDLYAPFQGERAWSEFRLVGLDVRLVHAEPQRTKRRCQERRIQWTLRRRQQLVIEQILHHEQTGDVGFGFFNRRQLLSFPILWRAVAAIEKVQSFQSRCSKN